MLYAYLQSRITKKEKPDMMILDLYYTLLDLSDIKLPFEIAIKHFETLSFFGYCVNWQ